MWVSQDDLDEDAKSGIFVGPKQEINEETAIMFAKGTLIEELQNNPSRGSSDIISIYDTETKELMTNRKYLK